MDWRAATRIGLATVGLACAVGLAVTMRQRPIVSGPPPVAPLDQAASAEGGAGVYTFTDSADGAPRAEVRFEGLSVYPNGRKAFTGFHFTALAGRSYELWADQATSKGVSATGEAPAELDLSGHVRLVTADGTTLETGAARYVDADGLVDMPGPVAYTRGRLSGRSHGATYHRDEDQVRFLADARAKVSGDASGRGEADISATRMVLVGGQKSLRLEDGARIARAGETLAAGLGTLYFTEDESALRFVELRERASVVPTPASATPAMAGDNITLAFHPDGRSLQHATLTGAGSLRLAGRDGTRHLGASWIDVYLEPDGSTITRLDGKGDVRLDLSATADAPARTITATTLTATGDAAKGLRLARFDGGVVFAEATGGEARGRRGTAAALLLGLGGGLEAIDRAEFLGRARFESGQSMAEADTIVYRVREGTVALRQATPAVRRLARVHSDSLRVDGIEIDLDTSSEDLRARGDLDVRLQPPAAAPHERAGLFESGEEIVGTGAALTYVKRTGAATFDGASGGSARLSQGTTIVTGARVRLDNQSQNLSASGSVTTTWIPPVEEGRASPRRPVVATADRFAYDSTKRTAEYEAAPGGPLVSLTSADGECRGERIVLRLSAGSSRIAGLTVERQVSALIEGGYEVVGDLLTFDAPTDIYVLSGTPARVRRLSTTGRGQPGARCEVNETAVLELNRGKGTVASRSARVPLASLDLPCDAPLRVPR